MKVLIELYGGIGDFIMKRCVCFTIKDIYPKAAQIDCGIKGCDYVDKILPLLERDNLFNKIFEPLLYENVDKDCYEKFYSVGWYRGWLDGSLIDRNKLRLNEKFKLSDRAIWSGKKLLEGITKKKIGLQMQSYLSDPVRKYPIRQDFFEELIGKMGDEYVFFDFGSVFDNYRLKAKNIMTKGKISFETLLYLIENMDFFIGCFSWMMLYSRLCKVPTVTILSKDLSQAGQHWLPRDQVEDVPFRCCLIEELTPEGLKNILINFQKDTFVEDCPNCKSVNTFNWEWQKGYEKVQCFDCGEFFVSPI